MTLKKDIKKFLSKEIDGASIGIFRIMLGIIIFFMTLKFFFDDTFFSIWLNGNYLFKYHLFSWVKQFPKPMISFCFFLLMLVSILMAGGFNYKLTSFSCFILFTYFFFLEKTIYSDFLYLICLLTFILFFIPADRCWRLKFIESNLAFADCAKLKNYNLWLLRCQILLVFIFNGINKIEKIWQIGRASCRERVCMFV